jgi:2,5-diketo-D-gluconate reductase A
VLSLGVFRFPGGAQTAAAVQKAPRAAYRHVDTARVYGNEPGAGLRAGGLDHDEVFVTTRLWNEHGCRSTPDAFEVGRRRLGLRGHRPYFVHWPLLDLRLNTGRAMEHLLDSGPVRAIGVSDYLVRHLAKLLASPTTAEVDQIELSPYNWASAGTCSTSAPRMSSPSSRAARYQGRAPGLPAVGRDRRRAHQDNRPGAHPGP